MAHGPTISSESKRIGIIHLDLGIGGAEQLIVNAAIALQNRGHNVEIFTAHHDPRHCFECTRDGTLRVEVLAAFIPPKILESLTTLLACLRFFAIFVILWLQINILRTRREFDVILTDQLPTMIPLFRLLCRDKVIYYCHFPDLLLCRNRGSMLRRAYRLLLDRLEAATAAAADVTCVNSEFTATVVRRTFPNFDKKKIKLMVVYPPLDTQALKQFDGLLSSGWSGFQKIMPEALRTSLFQPYYLSINRYERKKRIDLAISGFAEVKRMKKGRPMQLVIAGGYDPIVTENVEVYEELRELASKEGLEEDLDVFFLQSIPDSLRWGLLSNATAVLYTPPFEHFGIVPLEAMGVGVPVVAQQSGGPLETIIPGITNVLNELSSFNTPGKEYETSYAKKGVLCGPKDGVASMSEYAEGIQEVTNLAKNPKTRERCKHHVSRKFSFEAFERTLDGLVQKDSELSMRSIWD